MIQRIQTVYMFVALVAIVLCMLNPIGTYRADTVQAENVKQEKVDKGGQTSATPADKTQSVQEKETVSLAVAEISNFGIKVPDAENPGSTKSESTPWIALFIFLVLVAAMLLMAIFQYKKRALQMRLVNLSMLILIGYYLAGVAFVLLRHEDFSFRPTVWAAMPFVAIVLCYLAFRGILKDQLLIKSLDRLR